MAEEIKDLIQKIQEEGIKAAQEKAGQIEQEARQKAEGILRKARVDADKLLSEAKRTALFNRPDATCC
jgi:cell division septum initiation protein DivIVA